MTAALRIPSRLEAYSTVNHLPRQGHRYHAFRKGFCRCSLQEPQKLEDFRVACYSAQKYVIDSMKGTLTKTFPQTTFFEPRLDVDTAQLAKDHDAVVLFVNDDASAEVIELLHDGGTRFIAMRCAGFDRVDLEACKAMGIKVARVPTYSPESVAEHSVTLALALNRNLIQSHARIMQGNFSLSGLIGFEVHGKTVGIVGTGAIGTCAARIWKGFGTRVLAYDIKENPELEGVVEYTDLDSLLGQSHLVSLHCPLNPHTFHLIDEKGINNMMSGACLVNCSRGGLVDTAALIDALENGQIGAVAMDVYEHESNLFFNDFSQYTHRDRQKLRVLDRQFQLLLSFPNVICTPHTAFLTHEALANIADTTVQNLKEFAFGQALSNEVMIQA